MSDKKYEVELRGNTKNYRAEFGKSVKANQAFTQSLKGLAQGTAAIDGPLGGISGRINALNGIVSSGSLLLTGFGAAMAGLTVTAYQSLKVFNEYQKQHLRTEALVKATGHAAGFTSEQLAKQADEVALNTLASVGGIVEAQGVLLTFRSVSGDTFKQAIRLSQDMAATFGGSAKDKALQLGKALEDPTNGLNALKRSGVSFTESEKEVIKSMQETGNLAEAQRLILLKLEQQIGGAGSAEAGGLAGAVDTLGQRWDELMISFNQSTGMGEKVTYFINTVAKGMNKHAEWMNGPKDRGERLSKLFDEYNAISEKLAKPKLRQGHRNQLLERQDEIKQEIKLLNEKTEAEGEAHKKGALEQKKIRDELAADKKAAEDKAAAETLARQHEQGARALDSLKMQMATEEEALALSHQKRIEQIENLVLSEEQIKAQGFENLAALREEYKNREFAFYEEKQIELAIRQEEAHQREVEAFKRKEEQKAEAAKQRADTEQRLEEQILAMKYQVASQALGMIAASAEEGSAIQKAAFLAQQSMAAMQVFQQGEVAATAAETPPPIGLGPNPAGMAMAAKIRMMSGISAGLIMGQTFAGMFDRGGHIPAGKWGITGEYGPEITMGPTHVVGRQDTAKLLANASVAPQVTIHCHGAQLKEQSREWNPQWNRLVINLVDQDYQQGGQLDRTQQRIYNNQRKGW